MNPQEVQSAGPKQQVIERIRTAVNVLVTVSANPSVDQLSAAIGFTLMLNKLGKHATTVFSGQVPSTIEFLKPEETIEKNTDSLRDFIVSLDKSKADKLRYKVEENVVKIFITPYRTSISEKDLQFSQGDFNVDAVIALGVTDQKQLDQAVTAHGRILHDATVITVSAGQQVSTLGAINWQDASAASLCEMLVEVGETLQPNLLDTQQATAFLTGIVAQTDRFSNAKTSPKLMSLAARLMAAGANQQLIATQLENATIVPLKETAAAPVPPAGGDGSLTIEHEASKELEEEKLGQIAIDEHGNLSSPEHADGILPKLAEPAITNDAAKPTDELSLPPVEDATSSQNANTVSENIPLSQDTIPPALDENTLHEIEKSVASKHVTSDPTSTLREIESVVDSQHIAHDPTSTLGEIEKVMDSKHLLGNQEQPAPTVIAPTQPAEPALPADNLDAARDAVSNAITSAPYDPTRPEPLQALNASPVNLPLGGAPIITPTVPPADQGAFPPAPAVPTPPFPAFSTPPQPSLPPAFDTSGQTPPPVPPPITFNQQ